MFYATGNEAEGQTEDRCNRIDWYGVDLSLDLKVMSEMVKIYQSQRCWFRLGKTPRGFHVVKSTVLPIRLHTGSYPISTRIVGMKKFVE